MDLVDEENVTFLECREDGGDVALALDGGAGNAADVDAELLSNDVSKARLAEARRARKQHMVERLTARGRGFQRDPELLADAMLTHEFSETTRPQRPVEVVFTWLEKGRRHALCRVIGRILPDP